MLTIDLVRGAKMPENLAKIMHIPIRLERKTVGNISEA